MYRYNNYKAPKCMNFNINDIKRWGSQIGLLDEKENSKFMSDIDAIENLQLEARKRESKYFNKHADSEAISNLYETSSAMSILDRCRILKERVSDSFHRNKSTDQTCDNGLKQSETDYQSTINKKDSVDKRCLNVTNHQELKELYKGCNCSKKNSELNCEESQNESSQQIETKNCPTIMRVGISESCPIPRTEEAISDKSEAEEKCLQNNGIIAILRKRAQYRQMYRLKKQADKNKMNFDAESRKSSSKESTLVQQNKSIMDISDVGNPTSERSNITKKSCISPSKQVFKITRPNASSNSRVDQNSDSYSGSVKFTITRTTKHLHKRRRTEIIKSKHIPLKSKRSQKVDYHNLNQLNDVSSRTYINRKIDIIKEQIKKKDDSDTILK